MKRNNFLWIGTIAVILISICYLWYKQKEPETSDNITKIGAILPLTGDASSYGIACQNGMRIAASEDSLIKIIFEDSKADTKSAVTAINKLISSDNVKIIAGDMFSNTTLAIKPIAIKNKVSLITPSGASKDIPDLRNNIFSIYPSTVSEGAFMGDYITKNYSAKSILILGSSEEVFTEMLNGLRNTLLTKGIKVNVERFDKAKGDYKLLVQKIKSIGNFDSIYLTGYKDDLITIIKQIKESKINSALFSQSTLFAEDLFPKNNDILDGVILTAPFYSENSSNAKVKSFRDRYKKEFGSNPDVWSAYGYDTIKLIQQAIKDGNINNLSNTFLKIKSQELLTGTLSFNADGTANRSFKIFKISSGSFNELD